MGAAIDAGFAAGSSGVTRQPEAVVDFGMPRVAIISIISGPITNHGCLAVQKSIMHPVVMPVANLRRDKVLRIKSSQQIKRPTPTFIFDLGHQIGWEQAGSCRI